MKLYHKQFGFPKGTHPALQAFRLSVVRKYSDTLLPVWFHAQERAHQKGICLCVTPRWVETADLVELQVESTRISRVLLRGGYDQYRDLSVVIEATKVIDGHRRFTGEIVTGWTNSKSDQHRLTAERSKHYIKVKELSHG